MTPIWKRCPFCDDYTCTIHAGEHAHECPCPTIDEWVALGGDPYTIDADRVKLDRVPATVLDDLATYQRVMRAVSSGDAYVT